MRLINFLKEDIDAILKNNKLFQLYTTNKNMLLYRGAKRDIYDYQINKTRSNRKPKDMPLVIHNKFNNEFNKKFGWKARSEGVFATSDKNATDDFGSRYIFIPSEPYSFIYSTVIKDLFTDITSYSSNFVKDNEVDIISSYKKDQDNYSEKDIDSILTKIVNTYKNDDIIKAIKSKNEIMFKCDKYILMEIKYFDKHYKGI